LRFLNSGSHRILSDVYFYTIDVDKVPFERESFLNDEEKKKILEDIKRDFPCIEFFSGRCTSMDGIISHVDDENRYHFFGISIGLYVVLFQVWHPHCDLITNVIGRKVPYKPRSNKHIKKITMEEKWTLPKNYSKNMRGTCGEKIDLAIHGVWSDCTDRCGMFTCENVNWRTTKLETNILQNKLLNINYKNYDYELEKITFGVLQSTKWELVVGDCLFIVDFSSSTYNQHIQGTASTTNETVECKEFQVDGNLLDCYLSFNLLAKETPFSSPSHYCTVLCEWNNKVCSHKCLIVNSVGIKKATFQPRME